MLEDEVDKQTRRTPRGGLRWKGFMAGLIMGAAAGVYGGMLQESRHAVLYTRHMKHQIEEAAVQGYAWKEGSDPFFYNYERPALVLDPEEMTMQGYLGKIGPDGDTIVAGPIRKDGKIGYTLQEKVMREVDEGIVEPASQLKEKVKDGYHQVKDAVEDRFEKWFGKEKEDNGR